MLEIPPEWNEVPDFIMEDGDILPENMRPGKRRKEEVLRGRRKRRKKNGNILLLYLGGHKTLTDSIPKTGMKTNEKGRVANTRQIPEDLTDGVSQRSPRESSGRIWSSQSQVPMFNTKGADSEH